MAHNFVRFGEAVLAVLALCGIGYYVLCLWSARNFLRDWSRTKLDNGFTPPVSILKPLRGADRQMYESFRSHCLQDYPEYQLIFGVSDPKDPAIALVERLRQEFPERRIELVVCSGLLGANIKVSNLVQMLPHARYEHLIVNDSDIRVGHDYLRRILAPFSDERVGMVTTMYRGMAGSTLGSKLEAVGISTDFAAGVLAARQLEGIRFALGSTLAFTRRSLAAIGGFEPLLDYLADDFELGARIAAAHLEVIMSDVVVDTFLPDYSFRAYWDHQLRWARSTRDSRRWGYLGVALTFGLPWALVAVLLAGGAGWTLALLGATAAIRYTMAIVVGQRVLRDPQIPGDLWLLPLRDVLALLIWIVSYTGHTVAWRGDEFILENGKLRPVTQAE
ncbi:MAG: bacteriohopanetetrol glucosamine biosynthesis glycosyltransferase HpnI [Terriglobales bacterium]